MISKGNQSKKNTVYLDERYLEEGTYVEKEGGLFTETEEAGSAPPDLDAELNPTSRLFRCQFEAVAFTASSSAM